MCDSNFSKSQPNKALQKETEKSWKKEILDEVYILDEGIFIFTTLSLMTVGNNDNSSVEISLHATQAVTTRKGLVSLKDLYT